MALDAEPFALVEREGFKALMKEIAPKYPLPSRKYFSENIIPQLYDEVKGQVKNELSKAYKVSFTTDIWTSSTNNESFISLTVHFIESTEIVNKSYVLSCKHFPASHTGDNIGDILNSVMEEWNITSDLIHLIVRDNAANISLGTGMYKVFSNIHKHLSVRR